MLRESVLIGGVYHLSNSSILKIRLSMWVITNIVGPLSIKQNNQASYAVIHHAFQSLGALCQLSRMWYT